MAAMERAVRREDAGELRHRGAAGLWHVVQHVVGHDDVECVVFGEGKILRVARLGADESRAIRQRSRQLCVAASIMPLGEVSEGQMELGGGSGAMLTQRRPGPQPTSRTSRVPGDHCNAADEPRVPGLVRAWRSLACKEIRALRLRRILVLVVA